MLDGYNDDSGQAAHDGPHVISDHVQPRIERIIRQAINGRAIDKQIERMHLGIGLTGGIAIKICLFHASSMKLLYAFASLLTQFIDWAEVDGLRGTGFSAGRFKTVALAVVAERTFVRMTAHVAAGDDAERAGSHAARAAIADVSLNIDVLEFILNDGAGRAGLVARGRQAMLAMVAHHEPTVDGRLTRCHVQGGECA